MFKGLPTLGLCLIVGFALADPMRPDTAGTAQSARPAPTPAPEPALTLTSVYIVAEQRFAVINNRWLALNDTIHNYTVTDIAPEQVTLRRGGRTRTLTLKQAGELSITAASED